MRFLDFQGCWPRGFPERFLRDFRRFPEDFPRGFGLPSVGGELSRRRTVFFRSQGAYWGYFRFGGTFWCLSARGVSPTERSKWFLLVSEGCKGFWGIPRVSWVLLGKRSSKTVTSGFGRTSRANFEGLRTISEWGLGSTGCEGLKNGHFRFGGFQHGGCFRWFPERMHCWRIALATAHALWSYAYVMRGKGRAAGGRRWAASGRRWGGKWAMVGLKNGHFRFWREIWGLPERILRGCERFPSGDWVLPSVRG